jgi:PBP1b-binding outer membrane lipoprotein LpoB|tara:strand:+ start:133729 stop:134121 length:393 start_codon:yes stop_codon:yes gene_type:complete
MKTVLKSAIFVAGCTLGATMASAQAAPATPAPEGQTAPAPQAQTAPAQAPMATDVSDAEVDSFATALVEIDKVQADTTMEPADKQQKMVSTLQANGLEPQRFNAIAQAAQADPELGQRIQAAAQEKAVGN